MSTTRFSTLSAGFSGCTDPAAPSLAKGPGTRGLVHTFKKNAEAVSSRWVRMEKPALGRKVVAESGGGCPLLLPPLPLGVRSLSWLLPLPLFLPLPLPLPLLSPLAASLCTSPLAHLPRAVQQLPHFRPHLSPCRFVHARRPLHVLVGLHSDGTYKSGEARRGAQRRAAPRLCAAGSLLLWIWGSTTKALDWSSQLRILGVELSSPSRSHAFSSKITRPS